jgi:RimJ/RimL family protein N-acetyltransferase
LHDPASFSVVQTRQFLKENSPNYRIAEINGEPVGYFRLKLLGTRVQIGADLAPEHRGLGLARPLYLAFSKSVLAPLNVITVTLRVLKSNVRAQNLYNSMGFRLAGETNVDFEMERDLTGLIELLEGTEGGS